MYKRQQLECNKNKTQANISERHQAATSIMREAYENIMEDFVEDFSDNGNPQIIDEEDIEMIRAIDKISDDLDDLLSVLNRKV